MRHTFSSQLPAATLLMACTALLAAACQSHQGTTSAKPAYDATLAKSVGADERGMRGYVMVILKTGPTPLAEGSDRNEMFKGHFANMKRLAADGKLVLAGPFDGVDGWRGMFVFAVTDIDEAKRLVATDPVIAKGEMVAEFHKYYGSAALMMIPELSAKVAEKPM